jgi:glycine cleavage system transcriptional repressor
MLNVTRKAILSPTLFRRAYQHVRFFSTTDQEFLVVNAVGPDRPGIVSDLTKLVVDQGGNVGESIASRLGTHFGLMMLISVPKTKSLELQDAVKGMADMSTTCYATTNPDAVEVKPRVGYKGFFNLSGADNPGIVHKVTNILAKHRLNIDELKTFEDDSVPYGGMTLFQMSGTCTSPAPLANGFNPAAIRDELEALGDSMNCEITLKDDVDNRHSSAFYAG